MAKTPEEDTIDDKPMPLLDHLIELRTRLIWSMAAFIVCFIGAYMFADDLYYFLAKPLADILRKQGNPDPHLIYTQLYEAFFTRIKVAFFGGAFLAFPIIATQIWMFVAPGLYRSERSALLPFLAATPVLFFLGAALAYYFVFPFAWEFFASFQSETGGGGVPIELLPRVSEYLDLVMKMIFAFGITFDLAGQGRDHRCRRIEAVSPLRLCRDVRDRRDPGTAGRHHADRSRGAADRSLRNFHHCRQTCRSQTGGG